MATQGSAPTGLLVLVTGTGRSGTSTIAGALHHLGLEVPGPYLGANDSNPRGFYESRWAVKFHKKLLATAAINDMDSRPGAFDDVQAVISPARRSQLARFLRDRASGHPQVVVKDPRSVWAQRLWREAARDADLEIRYLSMLRHPAEVVGSRRTYYSQASDAEDQRRYEVFNLARWVNSSLISERETRGQQRTFVMYTDLLEDWRTAVAKVGAELGLVYDGGLAPGTHHAVDDFIDPDLRRVRIGWEDLEVPPELQAIAQETWDALVVLWAAGGQDDAASARLDEAGERYLRMCDDATAISHDAIAAAVAMARRAALAEGRQQVVAEPPPPAREASVAAPDTDTAAVPGLRERLTGRVRRLAGRAAPVPDAPDGHSLAALVRRRAEGLTRPVAVLVDAPADHTSTLAHDLGEVAGGPVVEVDVSDPSEAHVRLTALAPFGLIVDDVKARASRARRFQDVFHHLAPGGTLIVRDVPPTAVTEPDPTLPGLGGLLGKVDVARREGPPAQGRPGTPPPAAAVLVRQDAWFLAEAIDSVESVDGHLVVTSRGSGALAKIGEDEVDRLLEIRGDGRDGVLDVVPAEPFTSRCTLRTNATEGKHARPRPGYDPPPATLRKYHDVTCSPGQVVSTERVILPDTYRHNQRPRLKNRYTVEVAPRFAQLLDTREPTRLEGAYFHLDNELRGHFGHAMTEQVSRLWAWPRAKEIVPDLKVLLAINKGREMRGWEYTLYGAAGIARDDIVFVDGPVQVETLLSATPMLSMPQYVHPRIAETWRRMSDSLVAEAPERDYPTRFFCARKTTKRACHNAAEVEALFAEQGFEILYPEEYPIPEQAAMFRHAEVVAGYAGSALFNVCYAPEPKRVVMITSESYTASNEYMMASVLGHDIDLITCRADLDQPGQGWSREAFEASYTFDHDREGRFLAEVFASLG